MKLSRLDSNARDKKKEKRNAKEVIISKMKIAVKERVEKNPPSLGKMYEKYERCGRRKTTEKKDKFK